MARQVKNDRLEIRVSKIEKYKLSQIAKAENRTLSNLVYSLIIEKIKATEK